MVSLSAPPPPHPTYADGTKTFPSSNTVVFAAVLHDVRFIKPSAMETFSLPPVLIVDDDPLFRLLTRLLLESRGCTVSVAGGCSEALEMLATNKPGVALVDMVMPEKDGVSTIRELQSAGTELKFIACSGHDQAQFRADLNRLKVSHFLAKPFTVETLMETMRRVTFPFGGDLELPKVA
jgi:CheY-like chemotaxis protein